MSSALDQLIAPEIKNDEFYKALYFLARSLPISTILEIGASSGEGSTEALALGIAKNPKRPVLHSIEVSKPRFESLRARYNADPNIKPYNVSSVAIGDFPSAQAVTAFYQRPGNTLTPADLQTVLGWRDQDIAYIRDNAIPENGITHIMQANNLTGFDMVLIDGSEFTGEAELALCKTAAVIALDDINTYKNFENHQRLLRSDDHEIIMMNKFVRSGFSVFVRRPGR